MPPVRITASSGVTPQSRRPLYSVAATRGIERAAAAGLPAHTLMQRAGLSVARLALALAPHAQRIWVACGPGNNGGDGFEAAMHLHRWGKTVVLTWTGAALPGTALPPDAQASRARALAAGLQVAPEAPDDFDLCIDALLGIGATLAPGRPGSALMTQWLDTMQASGRPRLCVDIPTGLNADTGQPAGQDATKSIAGGARPSGAAGLFTLSLLTLKPGLFTAGGRDAAGEVWFDDLGMTPATAQPCAWLLEAAGAAPAGRAGAPHASHKGSFGDVAVLGGASSAQGHMAGAALLAARAALHAGAGRVFVALAGDASLTLDVVQPELMFRHPEALDPKQQVIVCGCGGGQAVAPFLPRLLSAAARLVLDADALNAIAADPGLQTLLALRQGRGHATVLTPHPLEAARLLGLTAAQVQADRLQVAAELVRRFGCVTVLKGSGSIIAGPAELPAINASGNALLATAGTGDVLAGMVGAALARGLPAFDAACAAVSAHGLLADRWLARAAPSASLPSPVLTASQLAQQAGSGNSADHLWR
ncbi:MAG: hypothetical protein JWQ72_107 [Polaromonas sp.]|nr:hypothetical protein [Polaromonas sp.]